ncbi:cysteine--tRNA ligase [Candidatus Woesearchaeota archaeon]|jgi:cysteinyl-tRNA synthetase|nr:cysteine--tRNA ligase [Candidatus Woesearchaeota archaeon]MBT7403077.1 cysteine--tRNA ligase [Candidatus Woesearchaeota archaeon]
MIRVYNTLTRKKEEFKPIKYNKINLFVCGPTVYDSSHIGHARTYVSFDIIVKYLRYSGYDVFYLQNITDIDDKIIRIAKESKIDPLKLSNKFTKEYYADMKSMKINAVTKYAKATEHIKDIIKQTRALMDKGAAYELEDGIYFDISKFRNYGKMSGRTVKQAEDSVTKIDSNIGKKNKGDFCIWKFPKLGDPKWETKLGAGRPGWHIEDTAITEHYFGPQYDVHGGAKDLIFPHHENEIAIMETISGKKPLVKYWFHTGFLNVEGKKMSKSLKNFITIKDSVKKWDADVLRFMFISTHYRSPVDYSEASLAQAKSNLERIRNAVGAANRKGTAGKRYLENFEMMMNDDFNTPKVVALLLKLANELNKTEDNSLVDTLNKIGKILSIDFKPKLHKIPKAIQVLVKQRNLARRKGEWKLSDKIRVELRDKGYLLQDTEGDTQVSVR